MIIYLNIHYLTINTFDTFQNNGDCWCFIIRLLIYFTFHKRIWSCQNIVDCFQCIIKIKKIISVDNFARLLRCGKSIAVKTPLLNGSVDNLGDQLTECSSCTFLGRISPLLTRYVAHFALTRPPFSRDVIERQLQLEL